MVKIVKTPSIARQYMSNSELYGGWPLHGIPQSSEETRRPMKRRRKKVDIIDNTELELIISEADNICCSPDDDI